MCIVSDTLNGSWIWRSRRVCQCSCIVEIRPLIWST